MIDSICVYSYTLKCTSTNIIIIIIIMIIIIIIIMIIIIIIITIITRCLKTHFTTCESLMNAIYHKLLTYSNNKHH